MALNFRVIYRNSCNFSSLTKPNKWIGLKNNPIKVLTSGICYRQNIYPPPSPAPSNHLCLQLRLVKQLSTEPNPDKNPEQTVKKQSLVQRLKEMYKNYWYIAIPVHVCTSAIWFGGFYYAVKSGLDVIALLKSVGASESIIAPLRDSGAGYFALAFAVYKLATPLRYTVTVGVTTYAIKKLTSMGLIKPVPSKQRMKEMFQEKKNNFLESKEHYKSQMMEKKSNIIDEIKRYRTEMRNKKKSEKDKN